MFRAVDVIMDTFSSRTSLFKVTVNKIEAETTTGHGFRACDIVESEPVASESSVLTRAKCADLLY